MKVRVPKIYLFEKQKLVRMAFHWAMLIAYLGSLNPWFMWSLGGMYVILCVLLLVTAMLMARTMDAKFFTRRHFLIPLMAYVLISFYQIVVNGDSVNAYVANCFNIVVYFSIFITDRDEFDKLATFLCKFMGGFLCVSIAAFLLHLGGFPFPSANAQFLDGYYSFNNYFLFMRDDRFLSDIFPRFQSVFLEPGHLGTATVLLLFTQCGKWRRWYNIVLLVATLISFSLSAYILLTLSIIMHLWVQRKHFIGKLIAVSLVFVGIIVGSFFYNGGDNLLHDLIILRMEVDDGELVGNNRTTIDFDAAFESFLQSSDILCGRDITGVTEGNSGYKVYIYDNGLIGLFLLFLFYVVAMFDYRDRRFYIIAMTMAVAAFIPRAYLMWYSYFIPIYCTAMSPTSNLLPPSKNEDTLRPE